MIRILGGASRTGKGLIAHELMVRDALPYMSVDPLKMALAAALPSYPLDTNAGSIETSEAMWPFISALIKNCIETGVDYLFEGEILPVHVHQLRQEGLPVRACFVGYGDIRVDAMVRRVRANEGHPNDWTSGMNDQELKALLEHSIQFSQFLQKQCGELNLTYIDFSSDFHQAKLQTLEYLSESKALTL